MIDLAVICRAKSFEDTRLKLGWWSTPVPGLTWTLYPISDGATVDLHALAGRHQALVYEDWVWAGWPRGPHPLPVYAVIVDSNTSERRWDRYQARALFSDVLLIDQDDLRRFAHLDRPAYRWSYGVNPQVFYPRPKLKDVALYVARTDERNALASHLDAFMAQRPYSYARGNGMPCEVYAQRLGEARIVIHYPTAPQCRSHRFFDALASGCCLLTAPVQPVLEDGFIDGEHFITWHSESELFDLIDSLLTSGDWERIARQGQQFVLARHTWKHRAAELLTILEHTL